MAKSDIKCECKHAWTSHHKQIPLDYSRRMNIDVRTKRKHVYCVLCKKWCSSKDAPKDLI